MVTKHVCARRHVRPAQGYLERVEHALSDEAAGRSGVNHGVDGLGCSDKSIVHHQVLQQHNVVLHRRTELRAAQREPRV